jgi:hypothetical protein
MKEQSRQLFADIREKIPKAESIFIISKAVEVPS